MDSDWAGGLGVGWGRRPQGTSEAPAWQMELRGGCACWTEPGGGTRPLRPHWARTTQATPFAGAPPTDPKPVPEACVGWGGAKEELLEHS